MEEQDLNLYTLENEYLIAKICNYGARILQLISKKHDNIDIVDGMPYDKQKLLECPEQYFSATVGPICNRISFGKYQYNNKTYILTQNKTNSCCHSNGLMSQNYWDFVSQSDEEVKLSFKLPQSEWNYNCTIYAIFKLQQNQLIINYKADIIEPTPLAITSHPFFNIDGSQNCQDIILQINSSKYVELNPDCCSGQVKQVNQTFDFRTPKAIGKDINNQEDQQIQQGRGYDHCYILDDKNDIKNVGCAYSKVNDLKLTVFTNQPAIHLYTGNWLDNFIGKNNTVIGKRHSFCIECEQIPDSINRKDLEQYGKVWYQPNEKYNNIIIYQID